MTRRPPSVARARSPALRERRSIEERREQLLGAGHELFVERPYDQVSMDDVAQRAGVSKALVFHYFSTKRDLYVEIVRRADAELLEATLVPAEIPPLERHNRDWFELSRAKKRAIPEGGLLDSIDDELDACMGPVRPGDASHQRITCA